jgi:hypothetical protein
MTTAPTELKPCPFCQKPPVHFSVGPNDCGLMIECTTRGCVNPHVSYHTPADAIAAWNTRAPAVGGVRVKPLVWGEKSSHFDTVRSETPAGYIIVKGAKHYRAYFRYLSFYLGAFDTMEEAKAAAQAHHEAAILSALEPQAVDDVLDKAVEAALHADIIPLTGKHAGAAGVRLIDYLSLDASAAIELGVALTEKDVNGKPAFHWYSDIGCMEHEEVQRAILRPLIKAALQAAKEPSHG